MVARSIAGLLLLAALTLGLAACGGSAETVTETAEADPVTVTVLEEVTTTESADTAAADFETVDAWCSASDDGDRFTIAASRWFDAYADDDVEAMSAQLDEMFAAAETAPPGAYCVVVGLNTAAVEAGQAQAEDLVARIRAFQDKYGFRNEAG